MKKKIPFDCPECGTQKHMLFDASFILERQYEGLWFLLLKDADGNVYAEEQAKDEGYLKDFALAKHLKEAVKIASESLGSVYCPTCQDSLE